MVMRVFVAGGTGVLGRRLVPQLVARGHQVTATTTSPAKLGLLERLGADGAVMDGLDPVSVDEAVAKARPDTIVHQMTGLSVAHAGQPDLKHPDRFFAATNRLRSEGTDHLLAAAEATGVSHVVAQSFGAFGGIREGGWVKTEEDPMDPGPASARRGTEALRHLEDVVVKAGARPCATAASTGRALSTTRSSSCASGSSRWSGAAPATCRGCISTTRRALPSWSWSSTQRACSTSSTTNQPRPASGCPIWPRAQGRSRRCGSPGGWPGCWPGTWQ